MPAFKHRYDAGFTLVELLVSLVVLGLLSFCLAEGLSGRSLAWNAINHDAANTDTIEAARAVLADRIERIWPVTIYYIRPPGPDFRGVAGKLAFLAPPRGSEGIGPLRRYQLSLAADGDLVLDSVGDLALDPDHWSARQVLIRGVQALDLAYYGATLSDRTPAWRPEWRDQAFLPALIRVRLGFGEGDRRRWPDLVIHPMADIDAGCLLEVDTGGCKGR